MGGAADNTLIHGTAIAIAGRAALIRGPSGSGKSDLALRCLAHAPSPILPVTPILVSDDQVLARRVANAILLSPPAAIAGKIEVRGLGIIEIAHQASARLVLLVNLTDGQIERLPDRTETETIFGIKLPILRLAPREISATIKLLLALAHSTDGSESGAIDTAPQRDA